MEQDIKNLQEIINLCNEELDNKDENVTAVLDLTDLLSLRNLISRNKELEEKNKELLKTCYKYEDTLEHYEYKIFEELDGYIKLEEISKLNKIGIKGVKYIKKDKLQDDYIPKSKIKEKIEELKNIGFITRPNGEKSCMYAYQDEIDLLQELLEKRK